MSIQSNQNKKIESLSSIAKGGVSMITLANVFRLLHQRNEMAKEFFNSNGNELEAALHYVDKINEDICSLLHITQPIN